MKRAVLSIVVVGALLGPLALPLSAAVDEPTYPSQEWFQREAENYARTQGEPQRQVTDPAFMQRWQEQSAANLAFYLQHRYVDMDWPADTMGNVCAYWAQQCTGDPRLYPGVDSFYTDEGDVEEVLFFDSDGALLSGRVWRPRDIPAGEKLPGVVIETGSVQISETSYWWIAQTLVRNGYIVMTYDVRGQGRSDNRDPGNRPGSNLSDGVFVSNLVDSLDLFLSTPDQLYPHVESKEIPKPLTAHNPFWDNLDRDRIGIVGHSLGASGVSVVQGIEEWSGRVATDNPVDVAIAWDNLSASASLDGFDVVPRVPTMGQSADYGLTPTPFQSPPNQNGKNSGFAAWRAAGVPSYQVNIQGGTHYEWSYLPSFPTTLWDTWGNPLAEHYSVAWLDRWLKVEGEPGFDTADARLTDDAAWVDRMSFYYDSARFYPERTDTPEEVPVWHDCADIAAGCPAPQPLPTPPA